MAQWSKQAKVSYRTKMKERKYAKRGRASVAGTLPPVDTMVQPSEPAQATSTTPTDKVYIPDEVLAPATLEEKMTQLVRAVRLRTLDEVADAVSEVLYRLHQKGH